MGRSYGDWIKARGLCPLYSPDLKSQSGSRLHTTVPAHQARKAPAQPQSLINIWSRTKTWRQGRHGGWHEPDVLAPDVHVGATHHLATGEGLFRSNQGLVQPLFDVNPNPGCYAFNMITGCSIQVNHGNRTPARTHLMPIAEVQRQVPERQRCANCTERNSRILPGAACRTTKGH